MLDWGTAIAGIAGGLAQTYGASQAAKANKYAAELQSKQAAEANALARDQFSMAQDNVAYEREQTSEAQNAMEAGMLGSGYKSKKARDAYDPFNLNPQAPTGLAQSSVLG